MIRMRKWYLDLVTPGGEALIAYAMDLRWAGLAYRRGCLLLPAGSGPLAERRGRPGGRWPGLEGGTLVWRCPGLGIEGMWAGASPPLEAELLAPPPHHIRWTCFGAACTARVRVEGAGDWAGRGYAECLDLDLKGFQPPFHGLRWGRFQGDSGRQAIWIQWSRGLDRRWAWVDGRPVDAGPADGDGWSCPEGALQVEEGRLLRDARVGEELFGARWARAIPGTGGARDLKWLSPARWRPAGDGPAEPGWALHEEVRWD